MDLRSARACAALTLLAPLTLASSGCGGDSGGADEGAARPNVLLVVVDTLRRDHLSTYGYGRTTSPNLDALAARGLRYDAAQSQAPWTTPSIGALMTSRYPTSIAIRGERNALADELVLLPEALETAGYVTSGVISHSFLGSRWNFDQGFGLFDEDNVQGHAAVTSAGVTDAAVRQLGLLTKEEAPFFLFVHYFDPHAAYVEHGAYPFGGRSDYEGTIESGLLFRELRKIEGDATNADVDELRRLYDSEIAFTDEHFGRLIDALQASGAYDDTVVVVTADHGEEFLEHGRFGHAKTLYGELLDVPLVIKPHAAAGIAPGVIAEPVGLVDVYPTILSLAGVPAPEGLVGASIAPVPPSGRPVFSETGRSRGGVAVREGSLKLIVFKRGGTELYDLATDPGETRDLASERPADVERLSALVDAWRERATREVVSGAKVELDAEQRNRIDELGYGGDGR